VVERNVFWKRRFKQPSFVRKDKARGPRTKHNLAASMGDGTNSGIEMMRRSRDVPAFGQRQSERHIIRNNVNGNCSTPFDDDVVTKNSLEDPAARCIGREE